MCYTYIKWATITPTVRTESNNTSSAISRNRDFDGHCRAEETVGEGARTPAASREGDTVVVVFFIFISTATESTWREKLSKECDSAIIEERKLRKKEERR